MERLFTLPDPHWVWDVPFHPLRLSEMVEQVDILVRDRRPSFFITANLNYVMLTHRDPQLRGVNNRAALVVADGITLVWASRWKGTPLPERVTGADLIYGLCDLAAQRGYGIFLLGGAPGVGELAARKLVERYPGLSVVGVESPPCRELTAEEEAMLIARIHAARPEMLLIAFGQPKGERWIDRHLEGLGVPAVVQLGAAFNFVAGRVRRAPRWMQRVGLETPYRIIQEPRRLTPRYVRNALFLIHMIWLDARSSLIGWLRKSQRASLSVFQRSRS